MQEYMPYVVSVLCSLIAGVASYAVTRKRAKTDLQAITRQHEVDIESLEKKHQLEIERINLEHAHLMEIKEKEIEAQFGSSLLIETMKLPEVRQEIVKGMRKGKK